MISIIVPVYNTEKYLDRCIQSILAQTYTDFELLLIDDGSTDSSGALCDKYAEQDSRIRVFHKENGGVSSARNTGLDNAEGEYIIFVDSDDYMKSQMCEILYNKLIQEQADIVICGTEETGGGFWKPERNENYTKVSFYECFGELLQTELLSPPWNKIFVKKQIKQRFRNDISFGEDLIFNLQYLFDCNKISFITASPYFHTKDNNESLVVRFPRKRLLDIENVWKVIDEFGKDREVKVNPKYFRDVIVYVRLLFLSHEYKREDKYNILNDWHEVARLKKVRLAEYAGSLSNKILLRLLIKKYYSLITILVNWRRLLLINR